MLAGSYMPTGLVSHFFTVRNIYTYERLKYEAWIFS
jgi:hypothetical protein